MFWAHVAKCAEEVTCHGHAGILFDTSKAEVGDPKFAGVIDKKVRRLDIAVKDAVLMGMVESFGGLDAETSDGTIVFT